VRHRGGGAHPRAIHTRLAAAAPGRHALTGRKVWATAATAAASLLVVASVGEVDGKNRLRVARVPANAPGLRMHAASWPFIPEIPHAQVELDGVLVHDTLRLVGSETSGRHASAARRTETRARMAGDASTPRIRYGRTPRMTAATFLS